MEFLYRLLLFLFLSLSRFQRQSHPCLLPVLPWVHHPLLPVDHLLYLSNFLHHHYHPLVEQSFFFVRQLEGILAYFPERGKNQKLKQEIKMKDGI